MGYLTGKTNSLVNEYNLRTLEDYINIVPKQKPLWLKIKNPIKYTSYTGKEVYATNKNSKIIFFEKASLPCLREPAFLHDTYMYIYFSASHDTAGVDFKMGGLIMTTKRAASC